MKNFMIVVLALTLGACTTTNNPIYTVKTESGEYVTQVLVGLWQIILT